MKTYSLPVGDKSEVLKLLKGLALHSDLTFRRRARLDQFPVLVSRDVLLSPVISVPDLRYCKVTELGRVDLVLHAS